MWKIVIVMTLLVMCCYCTETNVSLTEEMRATKKKKTSAKIIGMILLFIFSKVAVFKAVSMYLLMAFFQKLFSAGGLLLKHYLMTKMEKMEKPAPMYGPPQDYNTVGYSYGPPDHEPVHHEPGYPGANLAGSFDWLLNKKVK